MATSDYNTDRDTSPIHRLIFKVAGHTFTAICSHELGIFGLLSTVDPDTFAQDMEGIATTGFHEAFYRAKRIAYIFVVAQTFDDVMRRTDSGDSGTFALDTPLETFQKIVEWCDYILASSASKILLEEEMLKNVARLMNKCQRTLEKASSPPPPIFTKKANDKSGYVYLLKSAEGAYKIGCTKYPNDRLHTFDVKLPFKVEYEHLIYTLDRRKLERELHSHFSSQRLDGEWFTLSQKDIDYIKSIPDDVETLVNDILNLPLFNHLKPTDD